MRSRLTGRLAGRVVERGSLEAREIETMFELFARHYRRVDRATFDRDLAEKDWVLRLEDETGELRGFTTLLLYERPFEWSDARAVFSGNTIIDPAYWGEQALALTWCRFMAGLLAEEPERPLYWFLVSSGFRTYSFLPVFFREFYPRHDRATPASEARLMGALGRLKFAHEYRDGVVHVENPRECLQPELALPSGTKRTEPHVRFFLERNRGWTRGDELVCLTEFSAENLRRPGHRRIVREELGRAESGHPPYRKVGS